MTSSSVGTSTFVSAVSVLCSQQPCRTARRIMETDGVSILPDLFKCMVHPMLSFPGWPCGDCRPHSRPGKHTGVLCVQSPGGGAHPHPSLLPTLSLSSYSVSTFFSTTGL